MWFSISQAVELETNIGWLGFVYGVVYVAIE